MIEGFLKEINRKKYFRDNIVEHFVEPAREAQFRDLPEDMPDQLAAILKKRGIIRLYEHQYKAYEQIRSLNNIVVSTGVDSGKSLCYILPILTSILKDPSSCSLLLFPTKALAQDQLQSLKGFIGDLTLSEEHPRPGIYDGDTPRQQRQQIRQNANIILTNPDMLHLGILPHHTGWARFFKGLKYIVIDEVHIYRGIFGSHIANVLRRLKRIANYYGSDPRFIITSATLYNVKDFIGRLLEADFRLISENGAPRGKRHFLIYNPPVIDKELGYRKSALQESVLLANKLLEQDLQTLLFAHTRRMVELTLNYLRKDRKGTDKVFGYRSGYLPEERRSIEERFKKGEIKVLAATNAMELGIDIGGLDAVIIKGYPGSISSTRQQSGRAGRKGRSALTIYVATANLIDQFLVRHPEYLVDSNPEEALIDPDNPFILLNHLKCALFEKPFSSLEKYGDLSPEQLDEYLRILQKYGMLHKTGDRMYWKGGTYPAESISLRSAGVGGYILNCADKIIGTVDENSAFWMTHPDAVYLHNGETFLVNKLDLEKQIVDLVPLKTDYYTQSQSKTELDLIELEEQEESKNWVKYYGSLNVRSQVTGYKKMRWMSNEVLGYGEVELPAVEYVTSAFWLRLNKVLQEKLTKDMSWNNDPADYGKEWEEIAEKIRNRDEHTCQICGSKDTKNQLDVHHKTPLRTFADRAKAHDPDNLISLCRSCHQQVERRYQIQSGLAGLTYLLLSLAPVYLLCDRTDIRGHFEVKSKLTENDPAIILYEAVPGGIGLSSKLFRIWSQLGSAALEVVSQCDCRDGCPACTGPVADQGQGSKKIVVKILKYMLEK